MVNENHRRYVESIQKSFLKVSRLGNLKTIDSDISERVKPCRRCLLPIGQG